MSLPHLLLVDDSEAVLAFETAVLTGRYELSTAADGVIALEKVRRVRPDAMLLDLSMPRLGGAEVLAALQQDPELAGLPVLIISSEIQREGELRAAGAQGFLGKPIKADQLLAEVDRLLTNAALRARQGGISALFLRIGDLEVGVPLLTVERVLMQPATSPLPGGASYLSQMFLYEGEPLGILDLASRLSVPHTSAFVDRKLVVFERRVVPFALQVDSVEDPEDFEAHQIRTPAQVGLDGSMGELITAVVRTDRGTTPILDPRALISRRTLRELPVTVRRLFDQAALAEAATLPALGASASSANGAALAREKP